MTATADPTPDAAPASPLAEGLRVGFLGPVGTFAEQALLSQPDLAAATLVPMATMPDVLEATEAGDLDLGFVAIENSIEGTVNVTLDTLAFGVDLLIQREVVLAVQLYLMARPGTALADVHTVLSFPHASAQCRGFLAEHLPGVTVKATNSTADAARFVAESDEAGVAAIAPAVSAQVYGLDVLAADIADHSGNATRFVLVARGTIPPRTGHDRTSLVIFQDADRPGSLLGILQEFAARDINLSKLESRPTKRGLGHYCFIIEADGHLSDPVMADCLRALKATQSDVKLLGSFPVAGAEGAARRRDADEAWLAAERWVDGLQAQVAER